MKLFECGWGLVSVFVIADTLEDALALIRKPDSKAREDYPTYMFSDTPDYTDEHENMMTAYGWD